MSTPDLHLNTAGEAPLQSSQIRTAARAPRRLVVFLATSASTMGGIAAVLNSYRAAGLFERWPIEHIATHCDGTGWQKLKVALAGHVRFWSLLMRGRIAVVHVHGASNASFWRKTSFMLVTLLSRIPVIFHLHGGGFMEFYRKPRGALRRWLIRFVLDRAATIVVLSDEWRRRVETLTRNRRIVVVENPVDTSLLSASPAMTTAHCILFTGRLVPEKGVMELIDAFAAIHAERPSWRLQFAGQGDLASLQARVQALGLQDCVDFLGWISGAEKLQRLQNAGIYVLPSWIEGLPMSLLEAMAIGLPVIATRVGAIPEVVREEVNGKLIDARDTASLTNALLDLTADEAKRARLGHAARQTVAERFSPAEILPRLETLYRNLGVARKH